MSSGTLSNGNSAPSARQPRFSQSIGRRTEPVILREGYTKPHLTPAQHTAVVLASSVVSAIVERPILNLTRFAFLLQAPGAGGPQYVEVQQRVVDKRSHFFRELFRGQWFRGRNSITATAARYGGVVGAFTVCRDVLHSSRFGAGGASPVLSSVGAGLVAGGLAGFGLAVVRHPFDVLHAATIHPSRPKEFSGILDVVVTALKHNPRVLRGLYKGFLLAAAVSTAQYAACFAWYEFVKEDLVARGSVWLMAWVWLGCCVQPLIAYPLHSLRRQVLASEVQYPNTSLLTTTRLVLRQLRKNHGVTKLYDGFFSTRPFLSVVPFALMIVLQDVWSRRYTEFLHPERKLRHSHPEQDLLSYHNLPKYALQRGDMERKSTSTVV